MDAVRTLNTPQLLRCSPVEVNSIDDLSIEKPVARSWKRTSTTSSKSSQAEGKLVTVERAAEGDTVVIDFQASVTASFDGGSGEGTALELGSGRMIPGFEDGLIGAGPGDEKTLNLTFPEDYQSEELAGAAVEFKVQVKEVQELELAPVDDALFAQYGLAEGTEEDFRAEVKQNMERELRNAVEASVKSQVMDAIVAAHAELELPSALIGQEINAMRQQMFQQFMGGSARSGSRVHLPDEMFSEQAEQRVKLGLVVAEMISQYELSAEPAKARRRLKTLRRPIKT